MNRRTFIDFLGRGALATTLVSQTYPLLAKTENKGLPFSPLKPHSTDSLVLPSGLEYKIIAKWGDALFSNGDTFGYNNDFLAFLPIEGKQDEYYLWVNHESVHPFFCSGYSKGKERTSQQIEKEMKEVGGSLLHIRLENGNWEVVKNSEINTRFDGYTSIPFAWYELIEGRDNAMGTLANCAGGVTPWGTFLTCEENYDSFYGENDFNEKGELEYKKSHYGWETLYPENRPEHYGWVVEIDPAKKEAKKLVALGRFAHEGATLATTADGYPVVYMGDDDNDRCLYKFVSFQRESLVEGELYVANFEEKRWVSLDRDEHEILRERFSSETEMLIRCREAAKLVGGTPLDRPEDIEIDPETGAVIVALTNNIPKENFHGSLLKIIPHANDHGSETFEFETLMAGSSTGFSCPDNMCFDPKGNLWLTTDISGNKMNKEPYLEHGNNSLFYLPLKGKALGGVYRVASAPFDAELTGLTFAPDGKTLFLCVQHPGELSGPEKLTSHFPEGGTSIPKPCVVAISGKALEHLMS